MRHSWMLLFLFGCPGEPEDTDTDTDTDEVDALPSTIGDCDEGTNLVYDDVEPVFAKYCTGCHSSALSGDDRNGAPQTVNFDTYEEASDNGFLAWPMIFSERMPKEGGPLPEEDALLLWEWWSCEAPE